MEDFEHRCFAQAEVGERFATLDITASRKEVRVDVQYCCGVG